MADDPAGLLAKDQKPADGFQMELHARMSLNAVPRFNRRDDSHVHRALGGRIFAFAGLPENRIVAPLPCGATANGSQRRQHRHKKRVAAGARHGLVKGIVECLVFPPVASRARRGRQTPQHDKVFGRRRPCRCRRQCRLVNKPRLHQIHTRYSIDHPIQRAFDGCGRAADKRPLSLMAPENAIPLEPAQGLSNRLPATAEQIRKGALRWKPVLRAEIVTLQQGAQILLNLMDGLALYHRADPFRTNL